MTKRVRTREAGPLEAPQELYVCENPVFAPRCVHASSPGEEKRKVYPNYGACVRDCRGIPPDMVRSHLAPLMLRTQPNVGVLRGYDDPEDPSGLSAASVAMGRSGRTSQFRAALLDPLHHALLDDQLTLNKLERLRPSDDEEYEKPDLASYIAQAIRLFPAVLDTKRWCQAVEGPLDSLLDETETLEDAATYWSRLFSLAVRNGIWLSVSPVSVLRKIWPDEWWEDERHDEALKWLLDQPGISDPTLFTTAALRTCEDRGDIPQQMFNEDIPQQLLREAYKIDVHVAYSLLASWPLDELMDKHWVGSELLRSLTYGLEGLPVARLLTQTFPDLVCSEEAVRALSKMFALLDDTDAVEAESLRQWMQLFFPSRECLRDLGSPRHWPARPVETLWRKLVSLGEPTTSPLLAQEVKDQQERLGLYPPPDHMVVVLLDPQDEESWPPEALQDAHDFIARVPLALGVDAGAMTKDRGSTLLIEQAVQGNPDQSYLGLIRWDTPLWRMSVGEAALQSMVDKSSPEAWTALARGKLKIIPRFDREHEHLVLTVAAPPPSAKISETKGSIFSRMASRGL